MVPRPNRPSDGRRRRDLLRYGAATLAASAAGCLSGLPPLGRRQSYGRVDAPPASEPVYRRWLPDPALLDGGGAHYAFAAGEPAPIDGGEPEEFLGRRAFAKTDLDHFGVGYAAYDRFVDCPFGTVIEAGADAATVADALTGSGYDPDGSYRGYDLFARADVPRRAAIRDGVVVWSCETRHEQPDVEALVDAGAGEVRRYHEASDSFARLSETIGGGRMLIAGPAIGDPTDRAELGADTFRFVDDAAYQVVALRFPAARVPTADELRRAFRDEYGLTQEADAFDVRVEGRTGLLETRVPLGESRDLDALADPPQVTWGAAFDPDARQLTLRHEAGDPVDADLLWFDAETGAHNGIEKESLFADRTRVGPGDADVVDLAGRPDVVEANVVLAPAPCCDFRVLFDYELE